MGRCEDCYCDVVEDARRCSDCGQVLVHAVASSIVYALTYFGALGLIATGSWITGMFVASIGGFAFWRARRRMREIRLEASCDRLPRAQLRND